MSSLEGLGTTYKNASVFNITVDMTKANFTSTIKSLYDSLDNGMLSHVFYQQFFGDCL